MKDAFAHPFTLAADLLENGTSSQNVKFIGIERVGNTGIIDIILEVLESLVDFFMSISL